MDVIRELTLPDLMSGMLIIPNVYQITMDKGNNLGLNIYIPMSDIGGPLLKMNRYGSVNNLHLYVGI